MRREAPHTRVAPHRKSNLSIFTDFRSIWRILGIFARIPAPTELLLSRFRMQCIVMGAGDAPSAAGSAAHARDAPQKVKHADFCLPDGQ